MSQLENTLKYGQSTADYTKPPQKTSEVLEEEP